MTRLKFAELTWAPGRWLGVGLGALFPAWSQLVRMEDRSCQLALFEVRRTSRVENRLPYMCKDEPA